MNTSVFYDTPAEEEVYVFPASFAQQRVWFLEQLEPGNAAYNIITHVRLKAPLNVEILEQSIQAIVQRHEVLRTTIVAIEGEPKQVIAPSLTVPLAREDLRHLTEAEREAKAQHLATEEARRPFDVAQGPLLRTTLLQLGTDDYMLFLTVHHTVFDGWSIGVFFQELAALYAAFLSDQPSPLPDLPIQYVDYAIWQQEWLQGEVLEEQMAYWKKQLEDAPALLELPTDRPRPPVQSRRGSIQPFTLSKGLSDALKALSRQEGGTLYMTLVAAFQALLHRYTGQEDILIGSPVAGRTRPETENLIGFFINTLVLRTDLSGNPPFRELLKRVREVVFEADAHQDVPFEYLVKELQPERDLGQNPLFQVILTLEPQMPGLPAGWNPVQMHVKTGTSKFDLTLEIDDLPEGLIGFFEYSTDLFDAATIERMAGHWQTLLESIVAAPEQQVGKLPLLTEAERQQLLLEWNATSTAFPQERCVHQLFEDQVERTPNTAAVIYEDAKLTYRELNMRANQLAHRLQRLGVGPEGLVGICMERSLEMVVGFLGILKAGGAYVPLDPTYPRERLAFMLQDTQAPVLLTQEKFINLLPTPEAHVVCLDTGWKEISQESTENLASGATGENLAYVMYTSGSTGKPKGVSIPHRAINRLVINTNYVQLEPSDRVAQVSNASFDAATFEIWGALLHGAQLIGITKDMALSPQDFAAQLHEQRISAMFLTTALFNLLASKVPWAFRSVRHLLFGGEAVDPKWVKEVLKHGPPERLLHVYGPTECTTFTSWHLVQDVAEGAKTIPIGRPISNTQVYLLDAHLQPVPIGVAGELYIGGPGLAQGYLNRPELTAERFITHPFSNEPDAHLYKTGDQARFLPDGSIEFLARLDHQVKLRGFRIELGEIEAVLGHHPAVREVLVLARTNEHGEKRLVAYVVHGQEQSVTVNELRRFLKEQLPEYMVPSDFVLLDALPLTPNGKVDRGALPVPSSVNRSAEETFVAPTLKVHHQLKQIWEDLLEVRPIGITDNFFTLGGHSLLAARLMDRIEHVCGKKIPIATLFAGATIEHLAEVLMEEQAEDSNARAVVSVVQAGGARRPFFFLHGDWYGGGLYCVNLARGLNKDQPFYVLEPYKFDGLRIPPTFEAMAAAHIEALRAVQPEGPYLLGGFCNGGLMAYEIARQLSAQGQKVELLVLIDPATIGSHKLLREIFGRVGKLIRLGEDKQLDWFLRYVYARIGSYRAKVQESIVEKAEFRRKWNKIGSKLDRLMPTVDALRYQWSGIYRWIAAGYVPGRYQGKITLFWSSEAFNADWRKVSASKQIEEHVFPGTHLSSRNENLHILAERLNICLVKAQEAE